MINMLFGAMMPDTPEEAIQDDYQWADVGAESREWMT
jgi:hypothetical protein